MCYSVRPIETKDIQQVKLLLYRCFGYMAVSENAFYPMIGRYIVACDGDRVIGVSGIITESLFAGYEVTWTCVDEEYRHMGVVTDILRYAIDRLPSDHTPVYCSCWRIRNNTEINLHGAMNVLGFNLCQKSHKLFVKGEYKSCTDCPNSCESCYCACDLYKLIR